MKDYVIKTKRITKSYGSLLALNQIDLHVEKGAVYGLIGDNGAGKSTLLKLIAGLAFATSGKIYLFGHQKEIELSHVRKKIGCLIEQPGFFPNLTVQQTLNYYFIQKGIVNQQKILELLQLTGLSEKRRSKCKDLSLGQKQRLGLAIALIGEPQLLVLDEPINGLDPTGILEFRRLLHHLNTEKNITILLSSHILPELQQIATTYGFLNNGKLIEEISAQELYGKCSNRLEISVADTQQYTVLLERISPKENYSVLPEDVICIQNPLKEINDYSKLALENNITIHKIENTQMSLEDYYMELKKRGKKSC